MKHNILYAFLISALLFSCGTKKMSTDEIKTTTNTRVSQINANKVLKVETTEGALTDKDGFNDIGKFKYTVYFDENTKDLYRIENVEMTNKTLTETYYFDDNDLFFIKASSKNAPDKTVYTKGFKLLMKKNATDEEAKLLIDKAKRFKSAFKK